MKVVLTIVVEDLEEDADPNKVAQAALRALQERLRFLTVEVTNTEVEP